MNYGNPKYRKFFWSLPVFAQDFGTACYGYYQNRRVFGDYYWRHYSMIERSQWFSPEEMREHQRRLVVEFVHYAVREAPYYRDVFKRIGIAPEDVRDIDDLSALPILDKETVRNNSDRLVASSFRGMKKELVNVHTSGTTGKGLHLVISREAWQREYAFRCLHLSWAGITPKSRMAFIAGHPVTAPDRMEPPYWAVDRYNRHIYFSSQHISSKTLPHYVERLAAFGPELVRGYPSSVYMLALGVLDHGRYTIRPKAVFTNSETLWDFQRAAIEEAFRCNVYNWYGNAEQVGNIVECERGRLHVKEDHSLIEFVKPDGRTAQPGEAGEMVCTGFGNFAMPLIRYRIGDLAIPSGGVCDCGRSGQIVEQLIGRVEDIVVTPEGRHVGRLDHLFKDMLNVEEAQIIQEDVNSLTFRIVKRPAFGEMDLQLLEREARLRLGGSIRLKIEFTSKLERTASGKLPFVISRVDPKIRGMRQTLDILRTGEQDFATAPKPNI